MNWIEKVECNLGAFERTHHKYTYRGIPMRKFSQTLAQYTKLIYDLQPTCILEIGTDKGGSLMWFTEQCYNLLPNEFKIISIDIEDKLDPAFVELPDMELSFGGWQNFDISDWIDDAYFDNLLVIDDGSHKEEDVYGAFMKFSPFATYYVVEDGHLSFLSDPVLDPLKGLKKALSESPEWEVDRAMCDLFGTNNTSNINGFLKRKNK